MHSAFSAAAQRGPPKRASELRVVSRRPALAGWLLSQLTKQVLETGLEVAMEEHLGYEKHAAEGRDLGNSRNGTRSKNGDTEIGPVELEVPRDRGGSLESGTAQSRIGPTTHPRPGG